jgi:hypothetical protein
LKPSPLMTNAAATSGSPSADIVLISGHFSSIG